jgi:hypothetical protein
MESWSIVKKCKGPKYDPLLIASCWGHSSLADATCPIDDEEHGYILQERYLLVEPVAHNAVGGLEEGGMHVPMEE